MVVLLLTAIGTALTASALERLVLDAPIAWCMCVEYAVFLLAPLLLAGRAPSSVFLGAFSFGGGAVLTALMLLGWLVSFLSHNYGPKLLTDRHLMLEATVMEFIATCLALIVCGMIIVRSTGQHTASQTGGSTGAAHGASRPRLPRYP